VNVKWEETGAGGLPNFSNREDAECVGEFMCLAVRSDAVCTVEHVHTPGVAVRIVPAPMETSRRGRGIGTALGSAAEAHCRRRGCTRMQLVILTPAEAEPTYKTWLQTNYRGLGYTHRSTLALGFEVDGEGRVVVDEVHEIYKVLQQLVPCKAILFNKRL